MVPKGTGGLVGHQSKGVPCGVVVHSTDNDDDFFHVTCHLEDNLKIKSNGVNMWI